MELPCIVEYVRFRADSGFAILSASLNPYSSKYNIDMEAEIDKLGMKNKKYDSFTVSMGDLEEHDNPVGKQLIFVGEFTTHPKYGPQFKADIHYQDEPATEEGLQAYLMSFPNIKKSRSASIIGMFGVEGTLRVFDEEPERLLEISGITKARLEPIKKQWKKEKAKRELHFWLSNHGIQPKMCKDIFKRWQEDSINVLSENPYRLTEIWGIGFPTADNVAHKILKDIPVHYRTKAAMMFVLLENTRKQSNLCMPYDFLKTKVEECIESADMANHTQSDITEYKREVPCCIKEHLDEFAAVKNKETGQVFVYSKSVWEQEKYIAGNLFKRHLLDGDKSRALTQDDLEDAERDVSEFSEREISLDDCQKEAIKSAFEHKLTIITGGGGTGKSTICRCIFHLAQQKHLYVRMMSPTGKAAQVLYDKTDCGAQTIHRSLGLRPGDMVPRDVITEDIVVIDEASMIGIDTMYAIMVALENNPSANVIFVGDTNQLPSVSAGNFLHDITKSECANVVKLDKIHRQDENSFIAVLANEISHGRVVDIPIDASDIKWHTTTGDFAVMIKGAVRDFLEVECNIDRLQILSPMYKGEYGVNNINAAIQEMMSARNMTTNDCLQRNFNKFYKMDRIIQLENNYDKEVFNGDIGTIVDLGEKVVNRQVNDKSEKFITVDFYGNQITYLGDDIDQIRLAWCITVHKYQGSQSPYIMFVMSHEAQRMMTKELVYTAFTRAEEHLDVYGSLRMLATAPTQSALRQRYTNMIPIIRQLRENSTILEVLE